MVEAALTIDELEEAQQLQLLAANDDASPCAQPSPQPDENLGGVPEQQHSEHTGTEEQPSVATGQDAQQEQHQQSTVGQWRFVEVCCGKQGHPGHFVRTRHGSREVPTKVVSRHVNWGWIMDACWSVSTSFPLPRHGVDESLEDNALPMTVQTQREEAMAYNYGMNMPNAVCQSALVYPGSTTDVICSGDADGTVSDEITVNPDAILLAGLLGVQ